jgi:hypothetical protein
MTPLVRSRWLVLVALVLAAHGALAQHAEEPAVPFVRWYGDFRPMLMTQSIRLAAGNPGRYTGNVDVTLSRYDALVLYRVDIEVSSNSGAETLEWGVSRGRCGSKLIMLEDANQLPPIMMHAGGVGEVTHEVGWDLSSDASYQVGIFRGGHLQQNMVACANLKFDRGR